MEQAREIPCFRVLGASIPFKTTCMRVGWKAAENGIFVPKVRFSCDVLHLSGIAAADTAVFAENAAELCAEVGAKAIFWSPETPDSRAAEIVSLWKTRNTLRVFSPYPETGATVVSSDLTFGVSPFAAAVIARATLTEIRNGKAAKRTALPGEIGELLVKHRPEVAFSAELAANFFTLRQNDTTIFAVFDTEETLAARVIRAQQAGASAVFCDFCEKI